MEVTVETFKDLIRSRVEAKMRVIYRRDAARILDISVEEILRWEENGKIPDNMQELIRQKMVILRNMRDAMDEGKLQVRYSNVDFHYGRLH